MLIEEFPSGLISAAASFWRSPTSFRDDKTAPQALEEVSYLTYTSIGLVFTEVDANIKFRVEKLTVSVLRLVTKRRRFRHYS